MAKARGERSATRSPAVEIPSISAASEPRKRISSKPKKASVEKFIGLLDVTDAEKRLMLAAADLWYELRLAIDAESGPRAITYGERVNQSLTHMAVQGWMARTADKLRSAKTWRGLTAPRARERLDLMIVFGGTIEECAEAEWGRSDQSAVKRMRPMVAENLRGFAALARLPGAN
jgi:hypothetical protein